MTLWIKSQRKDGKYPVTIGFSGGVRLKKILTYQAVIALTLKADTVFYPCDPLVFYKTDRQIRKVVR